MILLVEVFKNGFKESTIALQIKIFIYSNIEGQTVRLLIKKFYEEYLYGT